MNRSRPLDTWGGLVICGILALWARLRAMLGGPPLAPLRATTPPHDGNLPLPRRVLAIKFYGLGNIAMLLPVLQDLRDALGEDAEIDFLTLEGNRSLLEASGLADNVVTARLDGAIGFLLGLVRAVKFARSRRYDCVIDFEQFIKISAIVSYCTGAPERVGFNTDGQNRAWLYTTRVVYTDSEHMSGIFRRLLRPFGVKPTRRVVPMHLSDAEIGEVDDLLARAGIDRDSFPVIAVHVGSGPNFYRVPLKRWPIENFVALCDALAERYGARIVLTGQGAEEKALVEQAKQMMRCEPVDTCDRLSVQTLLALMKRSNLVIANDTSVMHLAALVRTPVVAFFGPTAPIHYGPNNAEDLVFYRDLYCSPCLTNYNLKISRCVAPVCIRDIAVPDVLAGIERRYFADDAPMREALRNGPSTDASPQKASA
jgi:ADP-heptose:LPS heptosyltransferase